GEPIVTAREDKQRQNGRLAERRVQRAEQRRLEEVQKQADEEEEIQQEAEQRYRRQQQQQQQHTLLQERANGASQFTSNRFATRRLGENKQPSQTWRRPSSPPSPKQNVRNPSLPQYQAAQSWQESRRPQSPDIGLN